MTSFLTEPCVLLLPRVLRVVTKGNPLPCFSTALLPSWSAFLLPSSLYVSQGLPWAPHCQRASTHQLCDQEA